MWHFNTWMWCILIIFTLIFHSHWPIWFSILMSSPLLLLLLLLFTIIRWPSAFNWDCLQDHKWGAVYSCYTTKKMSFIPSVTINCLLIPREGGWGLMSPSLTADCWCPQTFTGSQSCWESKHETTITYCQEDSIL